MNLTKTYQREKFSNFTDEQIAVIARELQAIEKKEGAVRTRRVVELARERSHPLHPFVFGLSDREAAERFRIDAVRALCRAVRVVYVDDAGDEKYSSPMLLSCRIRSSREDDEGAQEEFIERAYRSAEIALADPATRAELLDEAIRQADYWQQKYRNLEELAPVFAALQRTKARAKQRRRASVG